MTFLLEMVNGTRRTLREIFRMVRLSLSVKSVSLQTDGSHVAWGTNDAR